VKTLLTLLAAATAASALATVMVQPAAAQWLNPQLSNQQEHYQRNSGWSDGDYFGSQPYRRTQPQSYGGGFYNPGLQNNIHYRQNSCSQYIGC